MAASTLAVARPQASRILSLDTFRGVVLLFLLFDGAVPAWLDRLMPGHAWATALAAQFGHSPWDGVRLWDLGQPFFMFMSGMAIPFAIASRRGRGYSWPSISVGVIRRSVILIALGLVIVAYRSPSAGVNFVHDVLLQIGLAAPFAYAIAVRPIRTQIAISAAMLVGYWLLFAMYPVPSAPSALASGSALDAEQLTGFFAHWNPHTNVAAAFDRWFLNLFPRSEPFRYDGLGLATLNFVPSIVTMVMGASAGQLFQTALSAREKRRRLAWTGAACVVVGLLAGATVCPIVKPLWTPSWTLVSGGLALLALSLLDWMIEVRGLRRAAYPFVVLGANALFVYVALSLLAPLLWAAFAATFGPISYTLELFLVNALIWLAAAWLYERRAFVTA
jgi:predicted acyltransferase